VLEDSTKWKHQYGETFKQFLVSGRILTRLPGPIVYLTVAGQPVVVLNTIKAAADLFDRRADLYSDRHVSCDANLTGFEAHFN
jgi:hypothetical protein